MRELYCEFILENIIMFTNSSLRRSEHKFRNLVQSQHPDRLWGAFTSGAKMKKMS